MSRTTQQPVDGAVSALSRVTIVKEAFWRVEKMLNRSWQKRMRLIIEKINWDDKLSKTSSIMMIVAESLCCI